MGVCNCSMFCCTLLYVHSSIAIILMGKRELIALLGLSSWCLVVVERLFLAVPRGCLQFVIVVFPDHTHLLFLIHYFRFQSIYLQYSIDVAKPFLKSACENQTWDFSRSSKIASWLTQVSFKLDDLKVLKRSPDFLNNVKIGQDQLRLIIETYFVWPCMGVAAIFVKSPKTIKWILHLNSQVISEKQMYWYVWGSPN